MNGMEKKNTVSRPDRRQQKNRNKFDTRSVHSLQPHKDGPN